MRHAAQVAPEQKLLSITGTMPQRVAALCPHFGQCGGCQLQDVPYEHQLIAKQAMLIDVLHASGIPSVPAVEVHSAQPWEYRNRIRLRVYADNIGYSRRGSNDFLAIDECPIASPLLIRMALRMRDLVREGKLQWPEGVVAMELFTDSEEKIVQLSMHTDAMVTEVSRNAPPQLRLLCDTVRNEFPQLVGGGLSAAAPDKTRSKRVQATQRIEIARWGESQLTYHVAENTYRITRNAFFQVNRFLTSEMVKVVVDHRSGHLVLDLFAGAGLFSVPLAMRYEQEIAVEIGEPAVSDLASHLAAYPQHRVAHATVQDFLARASVTPDLVVMDPPRAGVSMPALRSLLRMRPHEIVYVSCDAETFARDAKTLLEGGYAFSEFHLLDLFPQTFHTETIAVFRRETE
ncbi:23S rRNA (uracil(1939)-C(5))-methyltransferase RlmD [Terriglobus roseus]|uniref:23S rRNA m(5)U-1939 methyltransferase n=1 Tax=Terriglobus roseus TaxID=392734 RepID=A0A1G7LSZ0_9BACT|nr:23S rRNA (uracil(1939)-C(5))-methyltransferase RlmD [Terriglobus roseus]SDF52090.1 23S rRNA m(5)U-1939 methyltransferase [Terriglobus roseus]